MTTETRATFVRVFMLTTGVISVISGLYLFAVYLVRQISGATPPRVFTVIITGVFLLSFLLKGVCWILLALSARLWKTS